MLAQLGYQGREVDGARAQLRLEAGSGALDGRSRLSFGGAGCLPIDSR